MWETTDEHFRESNGSTLEAMWKTVYTSNDYTITDIKSEMFPWLMKFNEDRYFIGTKRNTEN